MNRSEIWLVNLDPTVGSEIKKVRPAVIVSADGLGVLPLRIIAPVTDWKPNYSGAEWMVQLLPDQNNGLSKISAVDCFQVRSVSTARLIKKVGFVGSEAMYQIGLSLTSVLKI